MSRLRRKCWGEFCAASGNISMMAQPLLLLLSIASWSRSKSCVNVINRIWECFFFAGYMCECAKAVRDVCVCVYTWLDVCRPDAHEWWCLIARQQWMALSECSLCGLNAVSQQSDMCSWSSYPHVSGRLMEMHRWISEKQSRNGGTTPYLLCGCECRPWSH